MNRQIAAKWLETVRQAWLNKDLVTLQRIYAKTKLYYENPFELVTSIEEILELWRGIKDQQIKKLDFNILAVEENTVIVNWTFDYQDGFFDGIFLIKFDADGNCVFWKNWEMKK